MILLADIGGTNARFAFGKDGALASPPMRCSTTDYPDLGTAMAAFLKRALPGGESIEGAAVCAAGPLKEGRIVLTNAHWTLNEKEIGKAAGVSDAVLVNDFTAVAMGVPALDGSMVRQIGGDVPEPDRAKAVLGPGTGLGVSGLIPMPGGGWCALAGEGGHVSLAPADDREWALIRYLGREDDHVSSEDVLSGPGLEKLYRALAEIEGETLKEGPGAAEIARLAREKSDPRAVEAVGQFSIWLGAVAGDLALILGARGGVYLAGGILPAWGALFDEERFRRRFEAKGRFSDYLAPIPCYVIDYTEVPFLGLMNLWENRHHGA